MVRCEHENSLFIIRWENGYTRFWTCSKVNTEEEPFQTLIFLLIFSLKYMLARFNTADIVWGYDF